MCNTIISRQGSDIYIIIMRNIWNPLCYRNIDKEYLYFFRKYTIGLIYGIILIKILKVWQCSKILMCNKIIAHLHNYNWKNISVPHIIPVNTKHLYTIYTTSANVLECLCLF